MGKLVEVVPETATYLGAKLDQCGCQLPPIAVTGNGIIRQTTQPSRQGQAVGLGGLMPTGRFGIAGADLDGAFSGWSGVQSCLLLPFFPEKSARISMGSTGQSPLPAV
jgi:hypothetical protein